MNSPHPPFRVVVALDLSPLGDRALEQALLLCGGHQHAEVHVIVVTWEERGQMRMPGSHGKLLSHEHAEEAMFEHINEIVDGLRGRGHSVQLEKIGVVVVSGGPAERICAFASEIDADLIVMGTHNRVGLERWVLGSVAQRVMRYAPCGIWLIRPRDFLNGEPLPHIDPPLEAGEHSLKPFQHRHRYHYLQRADRSNARILPVG
jgi:nucleotide-binding universal stress UspA family protein